MSDMLIPPRSLPNLEQLEGQVLLLQRQCQNLHQENLSLSMQLEDAKQTLDAIQNGQIDALVINTPTGPCVFSLQGVDRPYRTLIEQMQEGAVTLTQDGMIQYCNRALATLLKCPLEKLIGSSIATYVDAPDRPTFAAMLNQSATQRLQGELVFGASDGTVIPVHLGLTPVKENGQTSICMVVTNLTERQRTDEVLAKEQFIRRLIVNTPIGVAVVDPKLNYILANPAYQTLANHPILVSRTMADGFTPAVTQIVQPLVEQVLKSGQALEAKDYAIPMVGRRWWNMSFLPLLDNTGNIEAVLILTQDITQRKQAEEAQTILSAIVESSEDAIISKSIDGIILSWNAAAERMFGYSPNEIIGKPVTMLMPPERIHDEEEILARLRAAERIEHLETVRIGKDGRKIDVSITISPVKDSAGHVYGASKIVRDITHRKQAEQKISRIHQHLDAVMRAVPVGVSFSEDASCGSITGNPAALAQFATTSNENLSASAPNMDAFGRQVKFFRDGRRISAAELPLQMAVAGNCTVPPMELEIEMPDGRRWFAEASGAPVQDEHGKVVCGVAVTVDITERKRTQEALKEAKMAAESSNKSKDKFLAVLSHELRTPLSPVLTTVQMMESDADVATEYRDIFAMIRRNVQLEIQLIDDLLDQTRISQGKLVLHRAPVDLHEIQVSVNQICESDLKSKELKFHVSWEAREHYVNGDAGRLQQVLWNLMKNAVKFTPVGRSISIRTTNPTPSSVAISVSDSGVGISSVLLPRIFDAFEQGDQARQFGGLGLGLAISKQIAELHDGILTASSEGKGQGSVFTLELNTCAAGQITPTRRPLFDPSDPKVNRARILLVEDHLDTSRVIKLLLEKFGYEVRVANNVVSALQCADIEPFDLVISDIGLPDGSGLDLIQQLRTTQHPFKSVALSGYGMKEDIRKSLEAGFDAHLTKPVDINRLKEVLREMFGDGYVE